jgi:hypothetical protein
LSAIAVLRFLALAALAFLGGCRSATEITVTGTVTLDGHPLPDALVFFYPEGTTPGLGGSGRTTSDGKYTLLPAQGKPGISPGHYKVVISRPLRRDGSPADPNVPPIESDARETLPPRYSDRSASKLTAQVSKDKTVQDFALTKKGDAPRSPDR